MNEEKYKQLVEKLNDYIDIDGVGPSVSPTLGSDVGKAVASAPHITADMNMDDLTQNQLLLVHTLLHTFYARGGIKDLKTKDIERLHKEVKTRINHSDFDKLDTI